MNDVLSRTALIERLPPVRGRLTEGIALSSLSWFRVGGPAEVLFKPADSDDLAAFLARKPADVPVTVIGAGSNLLIRDGGVPGVVIRLGGAFSQIRCEQDRLRAGTAALDSTTAAVAYENGIGGLEFLSGIPGTIGGALRMNAGAYGDEISHRLIESRVVDGQGHLQTLTHADFAFAYRGCGIAGDVIFLDALLQGQKDDVAAIGERMAAIRAQREAAQPLRTRTGGSTFANPPGQKAWQLIDQAGCRGLAVGGAKISEKHCNFLINTGSATAADIEALGEEVRRRVRDSSGVDLSWEIRRIGVRTRME